jgi:hypothetical protein
MGFFGPTGNTLDEQTFPRFTRFCNPRTHLSPHEI